VKPALTSFPQKGIILKILLLSGRGRYVVQYLILLRAVNTDVLGCAEIANLRIKVMGVNVIS